MDALANRVLRARTTVGTLARTAGAALNADHRHAQRLAKKGITLPPLPRKGRVPGEVWGVTMVRNEIDVLPLVLDHLHAQGVHHLLVSDNGSTDGTLEELERRAGQGRLLLARDSEPAYYQAAKMTRLVRAAARAGADWIVPFDADELWFADRGTLVERLRQLDGDVVRARVMNAFPSASGSWVVDVQPHWHPKVAFRAHPMASLDQGNHGVDRPGKRIPTAVCELKIAHLPWRSFEQFASKVRQGAAAYVGVRGNPALGDHWRTLGAAADAELRQRWASLLAGRHVDGMHWSPQGPLVQVDVRRWSTWDPSGVLTHRAGQRLR